jgi:ligand-binding sensor domain-containing protein
MDREMDRDRQTDMNTDRTWTGTWTGIWTTTETGTQQFKCSKLFKNAPTKKVYTTSTSQHVYKTCCKS